MPRRHWAACQKLVALGLFAPAYFSASSLFAQATPPVPAPVTATAVSQAAARCALMAASEWKPSAVKIVYEVDGKLLSSGSKPQGAPREHTIRGIANYLYEERFTDAVQRQAVRYYREAKADVNTSGRPAEINLREDRRYVSVNSQPSGAVYRALEGPLSRSELELIELPGGSVWVDQLLPGREVAVGEKWSHDEQLLARLFNLDAVTASDLTSQLVSCQEDVAQLTLAGTLVGSVAGAVTELKVQGKLTYNRQQQRITWLALGLQEDRAVGLGAPGLRVTSRLRMLLEPSDVPHLDPQQVQTLLTSASSGGMDLLEYRAADGTLAFPHDRHWRIYSENEGLVIFRRIEEGRVIAQCNLKSLPQLAPDEAVTLTQFQTEVRSALGPAMQQIVDAKEERLPNGVHQLRVTVIGQVANSPVHWVYYQLRDDDGHQATCVFTMSGEDVARFGAEDVTLVSGITFTPDVNQPSDQPAVPGEVAQLPDAIETR